MCLAICGCDGSLPHYILAQGFQQGSILLRAKPIEDLLADPTTDQRTRDYLTLAQDVRVFARDHLDLKVGRAYTKYLKLNRDWVSQIVMASDKDKLNQYMFDFPVVGKLPYKGFFDESEAIALENELKQKGLDTYRRPVEAFSSTGFFPDPLLSTMLDSKGRLIELLIHELTHTTFYFEGEADFNEAAATYIGFRGALEYIVHKGEALKNGPQLREELQRSFERQIKLSHLVIDLINKTNYFYSNAALPIAESVRQQHFETIGKMFLEAGFPTLGKEEWNNARLLGLATYGSSIPKIAEFVEKNNLDVKKLVATIKAEGPEIISRMGISRASDR